MSCIVGYIVYQQYRIIKEDERREMDNTLQIVYQNIEQSLKNCYTTTLTLALTINNKGIPENFDNIGKKLLESNHSISAVQLVPNGVIKYTYPKKENESALNLNILTTPYLRDEALKSIKTQKMYFAGPLKLKQGGVGIVGRFPVFQNNKFWGFSAVIIRFNDLLKFSGINNVNKSKYYFQLSKKNPVTQKEIYYLPNKSDFSEKYNISVLIPDSNWKLYLISQHQNYLYYQILIPAVLGVIFAGLFGLLIFKLLKMPKELQLLVNNQAAKLITTEIKFKTIFDQAAIGIAYIDSYSGYFLEVNKQNCKFLGYSAQELKERNFQSVTYHEDLEEDLANMQKLREGKIRTFSMEKRYVTKSGNIRWANLTVSPLWNINEKPTTHIAIIEDITLKKETEAAINKSENHFKSLFEDSHLPLREEDFSKVKSYLIEHDLMDQKTEKVENYLLSNPKFTNKLHSLIEVVNVNRACLKLYKVNTKEELLIVKSELFNPSSYKDFTKQIIAITQNYQELVFDTVIKNSKEELRFINLRWNVIRGYEKTLGRIIVSTEDITERKTSEKIILDSQQRTESLINTIDGIVWECKIATFSFTFISKKVEEILGYTSEEWLASKTFWADHIHPEDREWTINYCVLKTNENLNHDFEYRMIAKNGAVVWLRDIVTVVFENGTAVGLRGIMIDITKTKKAEEDLNNSFNMVTEQNKRLLNFSYIVSHNLRSHTSNISSIMALIEMSESEEERNEMIQLLKSISNSLNETMLHLNEVINIRTNIGLVSESLNLNQYIDTAQNVLTEQITLNDVSITTDIPKTVMVNYNPAYLESILYNIISNSIRYRHPERKPVILIKWIAENELNVLQISDNGVGIDLVKNADKIFGMYKTFSNNADSKGIGLFITKNQIDAMGGNITVESEPNIGTTFKIYIQ
ncbi:PAS domain S-box-containing protein [Flavobacterium sp. CG_9.10]|uniref:PAS domain S-box protein n=1 Tax=Flavobacterium sp. CG_9.10 TaxID=2787729 RepID=UPI0018CB2CF3|nr:PAS domain S-box protein [Flavobacterium sp. CG_9.10]MBG6111660.1 PAS domain S-box-containing protein [Flavobacterium sp. CG_9.10]